MAYKPESQSRGRARSLISRTGYSAGGHFKLGGDTDAASDAKMITKGVHEHEGALHKGSPKTRMTFAEGGMAGMPRLDQRSRGSGGSKRSSSKGHGNTINIAVVPGGGQQPAGAAAPRPPMPVVPPRPPLVGPPGGGMPPGGPPGMAPAAAGGMGAAPPVAMPRPPMAPPPGLPPGVMPPRPPIRTGGRLARGGRANGGPTGNRSVDPDWGPGSSTSGNRSGPAWEDYNRVKDSVTPSSDSGKQSRDGRDFNPSAEKRGGRAKRASGGASDPLDSLDFNRAKRAEGGASDPLDSLEFPRERRANGGRMAHKQRLSGTANADAQAAIKDPPRLDIGNTSYMSSTSPQLENALAASDKKMIPHQQDQIFQPPPIQRKSGGEVGSGRASGIDAGAGSGRGRQEKARSAPGVDHGGIGRA